MKNLFKFIFFLIVSIFQKKKRFIICNPNLSLFGITKVFIYDKKNKNFSSYNIRNKYDFITIEEIFFYECYNISDLKIFKKIIKEIETKRLLIVDCGSNIGCSTNYFGKSYRNAQIVSIEPDDDNFSVLTKNVKGQNVILVNSAISNDNFNYEIKSEEDNRAISIIKTNQVNSRKTITINQILNEKINENLHPFLIKIDIEGHEKDLFNSNTEWFDRFDIVVIEIHDWMIPGKSISKGYLNEIVNSMKKYNRDLIIKGENLISIKYK